MHARRQADAAQQILRLEHRPRLIVRQVVIPELQYLGDGTLPNDLQRTEVVARYRITNVGGSTATLEIIAEGIYVGTALPMGRPDAKRNVRQVTHVLHAGESLDITADPIAATDAVNIMLGDSTGFFIVTIQYRDELDIRRHTNACRRYSRETKRFVPVDNPDYEYAD